MKFRTLLVCLLTFSFCIPGFAATFEKQLSEKIEKKELVLFQREAIREAKLRTLSIQLERAGLVKMGLFGAKVREDRESCFEACADSCRGGSGSMACWNKCTSEGYGSSTCVSRCGVDTSAGSSACWSKCTQEGYGSGTCSERCGIGSEGGSEACWDKCTTEGYGSSTCSGRCGITTPGGSRACWDKCTTEGYSSSTCAGRCGTE